MRVILVTRTGCPACTFLKKAEAYSKIKSLFPTLEELDIAKPADLAKLSVEERRDLMYVPRMIMIGDDGTHAYSANLNTPDGLKGVEKWIVVPTPKGPSSAQSTAAVKPTSSFNPKFEVIVLTSSTCPICTMWEKSGRLDEFLKGEIPGDVTAGSASARIKKTHYNVDPRKPPQTPDEGRKRMVVAGMKVPSVFAVDTSKWSNPVATGLDQRDVMLSPGDPRSPAGLELFKRWIVKLTDPQNAFLGYVILSTNPGCGHCKAWKENGGMDDFVKTNENIPGILLIHNELQPEQRLPDFVAQSMTQGYPSVYFVPALSWSSPANTREITNGPDPRDSASIREWIMTLTGGAWSNDPTHVPDEFQRSGGSTGIKVPTSARLRRALVRQGLL